MRNVHCAVRRIFASPPICEMSPVTKVQSYVATQRSGVQCHSVERLDIRQGLAETRRLIESRIFNHLQKTLGVVEPCILALHSFVF